MKASVVENNANALQSMKLYYQIRQAQETSAESIRNLERDRKEIIAKFERCNKIYEDKKYGSFPVLQQQPQRQTVLRKPKL